MGEDGCSIYSDPSVEEVPTHSAGGRQTLGGFVSRVSTPSRVHVVVVDYLPSTFRTIPGLLLLDLFWPCWTRVSTLHL
jgi:hypothetical protein